MGIFTGCLLASDIDGTLISNGIMCKENIDRINYFRSEGGIFSIATGRSVAGVSPVIRNFDRIDPGVFLNGGMIYDFSTKKNLYSKLIPKSDHEIVYDVVERFPEVGVEIHAGTDVYLYSRNSETDLHADYEEITHIPATKDTVDNLDWNKVLYVFDSKEASDKTIAYISTLSAESRFVVSCAVIDGEQRTYYEQLPTGISKASAVTRLCEIMKVKKGCLYAIGDYYNDLEMLNVADIGAVPEESPDDIKSQVDYVACLCADGAVADFINYLTKIRRRAN